MVAIGDATRSSYVHRYKLHQAQLGLNLMMGQEVLVNAQSSLISIENYGFSLGESKQL